MVARNIITDERGSVLPIFAICALVIFGAVGVAVDYSRAASSRSEMQAALDAASIMLAKEAANLTEAQLNDKAQAYFLASFKSPAAKNITVKPKFTNVAGVNKISLEGTGSLDTTVFNLFGRSAVDIGAKSEVTWGMRRLELALALDNTGSMLDSGKLDALKVATHNLIDTLQKASKKKDDIRVAIVPFTTFVNVDPKNKDAKWIDFAGWSELTSVGVETGLSNDWVHKKSGKKWTGCVTDRNQPYDTQDTAPNAMDTLFPAAECVNPVPMMTLSSNWKKLNEKIDEMKGDGTTNVTIGLVWAWHALTSGAPLTQGKAPASDLDKVIILLTDGDNTENRWGASSPAIDKRTEGACTNIKNDGIKLYTVRVIAGNATLLRNCATSSGMYYEVQQASQLNAVFKTIADNLATLRLSK
jgi:Flp pilus assembly protein TadG